MNPLRTELTALGVAVDSAMGTAVIGSGVPAPVIEVYDESGVGTGIPSKIYDEAGAPTYTPDELYDEDGNPLPI